MLAILALICGLLGCWPEAGRPQPDARPLASDDAFAAVGSLIRPSVLGAAPQLLCTATLIRADTVLSAKHCARTVQSVLDTGARVQFALGRSMLRPSRTAAVSGVATPQGGTGGWNGIGHDIGLVMLAKPIHGVAPLAFRELTSAQLGASFVAVGYGVGAVDRQLGERRAGELVLRALAGRTYEALFADFDTYLAWRGDSLQSLDCSELEGDETCVARASARATYDATRLEPASEAVAAGEPGAAQPCFGDSGGPLLQRSARGSWTVYAVLSGGLAARSSDRVCDHGAVYARIDRGALRFLRQKLGRSVAGAKRVQTLTE